MIKPNKNIQPVVVASFRNEIEMAHVRNKLESFGIETYTQHEHITALREFSASSNNGIKLLVMPQNYERTMNYLIEIGHYKAKDFEPTWLERLLHKLFHSCTKN